MGDHSVATFHATQRIEDEDHGGGFLLGRVGSFGEEIPADLGAGRFQDERDGFVALGMLASGQECRKLPFRNAGVTRIEACRKGSASVFLENFREAQEFCAPA